MLLSVPRDGDFDLEAMHKALRGDLPDLDAIHYFRADPPGLEDLVARSSPLSDREASEFRPLADDPGHVMVSSGSTGMPKASVWSNNDIVAMLVHHTVNSLQLTADDVVVGLAPASMGSTGYVFPVLTPLLVGASSVMLETWSPQEALDLIVRERRC